MFIRTFFLYDQENVATFAIINPVFSDVDIELKNQIAEDPLKIEKSNETNIEKNIENQEISILHEENTNKISNIEEENEVLHSNQEKINFKSVHEGMKCEKCESTFNTPQTLKQHIDENHIEVIHEGSKKYQCYHCDKYFPEKRNLKIHVETVHEGLKNYKCHICDYAGGTRGNLQSHIRNIHIG